MAIVASLLLTTLIGTGATARLDNSIYDLSLKLERRAPRSDIVIVAFDQASLSEKRPWPWPRRLEADVLARIAKDHPRAMALYLLFVFPTTAIDDQALHDAMTMGRTFIPTPRPAQAGANSRNVLRPIPKLAAAASGIGLGEQSSDEDGIIRRATLVEKAGTRASPRLVALVSRAGLPPSELARRRLPDGPVLIPYSGPARSFPTISAAAVLDGRVLPSYFKDKYVLIGPTAQDLGDLYPTPTSSSMSNVEIDANVLNGLLTRGMIIPATPLEVILASMACLWLLLGALLRLAPRDNLRFSAAMIVVPFAAALVGLLAFNVWFPPASFLLTVAVVTPYWGWRRLHAASDYFAEELRGLQQHVQSDNILDGKSSPIEGDVVLQQMTLLQEAKRRISDLRRFVTDILANFPEPIFVVDVDGGILTVNEAASDLGRRLGLPVSPDSPVDAILSKITPLEPQGATGWPPFQDLVRKAGSTVLNRSLTGRGPDGKAFELRFTPTLSAADQPTGWIVHLADITTLLNAVDQREVAMRQREEALQLLSHDMRSPQASIIAVLQHPDFKNAPARLLELVDRQARRTLDMADAFVRLAQAESAEYVLEVLDFSHIAEEAVDAVWSLAQQGGVTVELKLRPGEFTIFADRGSLMRALINLLDNAVKFSPDGGTVTCEVGPAVLEGRRAVACEIMDNAGGMAEATASKIFNRFATTGVAANGTSGVGLGLALVQAVAARHHGAVVCKTTLGVGSVFTFTLPFHDENAAQRSLRVTA